MRGASRIASLLVLVLSLAGASAFADTTINCPLSQARRTITDSLPDGWWTTPIVNRLTETKVTEIGGKTALLCVYGPSGSVQRHAPEGSSCRAVSSGFVCASSGRAEIFSDGLRDIPQTYTIDFDRGAVGGSGADLWFQVESQDLLYLTPRGGGQMSVGDRSNRQRDGCARARFSTSRVSLRDTPVGSYICMRTNEGRISQFRINAISSGSPKTLSIGYTTWK